MHTHPSLHLLFFFQSPRPPDLPIIPNMQSKPISHEAPELDDSRIFSYSFLLIMPKQCSQQSGGPVEPAGGYKGTVGGRMSDGS